METLREDVRHELQELADNVCPDIKTTDCYARLMRLVGKRTAYQKKVTPTVVFNFRNTTRYLKERDDLAIALLKAGIQHTWRGTDPSGWLFTAFAADDADKETLKAMGFKRGAGK